jgi:hypothetical protein
MQFRRLLTHVGPILTLYSGILSLPGTDCGWVFAQHFCNRLGPAYLHLRNVLDETIPAHAEVLNDIKIRFREETFTRESIQQVIQAHPDLVRYLYTQIWGFIHSLVIDSHALRKLRYGPLPDC